MNTGKEIMTYRLVLAISVFLVVVTSVAVFFFGKVSIGHEDMLVILQSNAERLERLETNKAKATAKRFTADDAEALMRCLRIPNGTRAREECIQTVEQRIKNK